MKRTKKELYQEVKANEEYIDKKNKEISTFEKVLNKKDEEIRLLKLEVNVEKKTKKELSDELAEKRIECNEWSKLNAHLTEMLIKTRAKLEVAKLPF